MRYEEKEKEIDERRKKKERERREVWKIELKVKESY